ncbi:MAG: glycosyltransferase, partial [Candidatus Eisenbacteria bacterium]|nr:glycosyltransferase [Candidatus Eisenbacteria bacterium]
MADSALPSLVSSCSGREFSANPRLGKMLRILHVISQLDLGGQESQMVRQIRGTLKTCEHRVVSMNRAGVFAPQLRDLGVVVRALERRQRVNPDRLMRLTAEVRRFRPNLIHGHLFGGNLYGLLANWLAAPLGARPPFIAVRVTSRPKRPWISDRLESFIFRRAQLVVVNAEALRHEVVHDYGLSPDRVRVLPNILDLEAMQVSEARNDVRKAVGFGADEIIVAHIGSFSPEKRHDLILQALARARQREPRLHLALIGDGPRRDAIRAQA